MPGRVLPIKAFAPRQSSSLPVITNTLVLAGIPQSFFHPVILDILRSHFEAHGQVHTFAPLKAFGRVLVVYFDEDSAEKGKQHLDWIQLSQDDCQITLRVFRGDPTPLSPVASGSTYLAPPAQTKNFLISPPGSPPVGWEQVREDPPNPAPLADDLMTALLRLKEQQDMTGSERRTKDGCEVLWHAEETPAGVGIYVENCAVEGSEDEDDASETFWYGPDRMKDMMLSMSKTAVPPKSIMNPSLPRTYIPKTSMPPRQGF